MKLALKQISEGQKTNSDQVKRDHLISTIKYLLRENGWIKGEVSSEEDTPQSQEVPLSQSQEILSSQPLSQDKSEDKDSQSQDKSEDNNSQTPEKKPPMCRHFQSGKCRHGITGKTIVQDKTCEFDHPKTCQKFDNYGYKQGGCKDKKCKKGVHLRVCRQFMNGYCKFEKCKYYHPRKLKIDPAKKAQEEWFNLRMMGMRQQAGLNPFAEPWIQRPDVLNNNTPPPAENPVPKPPNDSSPVSQADFLELKKMVANLIRTVTK